MRWELDMNRRSNHDAYSLWPIEPHRPQSSRVHEDAINLEIGTRPHGHRWAVWCGIVWYGVVWNHRIRPRPRVRVTAPDRIIEWRRAAPERV